MLAKHSKKLCSYLTKQNRNFYSKFLYLQRKDQVFQCSVSSHVIEFYSQSKKIDKRKLQDALDWGIVEQVLANYQQNDCKPYAGHSSLIFEKSIEKTFKDFIFIGTDKISFSLMLTVKKFTP